MKLICLSSKTRCKTIFAPGGKPYLYLERKVGTEILHAPFIVLPLYDRSHSNVLAL